MTEASGPLGPLHKTVTVALEPSAAFELFTAKFHDWWPLATHSVGLSDAVSISFPGTVGEPIVETLRDGSSCEWGILTRWDPPRAVGFTWHPGQDPSIAGDVEVRFTTDGGGTVVELIHTGWERRADGATARTGYDSGWQVVLAAYGVSGRHEGYSPTR